MDGVRVVKHMARLSEWKERIIVCRNSGQAVQAWCEESGINPKTYYRWERLLMAEAVRIAVEHKNSGPSTLPGIIAGGLNAQASQAQVRVVNSLVDKKVSNGQAAIEILALSQSIGLRQPRDF